MEKQEKIVFLLPAGSIARAETMWADEIGQDKYRLDNVPIFVPLISIDDEFIARIKETDDSRPYFEKLIKRSENVTHRIWISDMSPLPKTFDEAISSLKTLTDRTEEYEQAVFAFSVSALIEDNRKKEITAVLSLGEQNGWWRWDISSTPDFPLTDVDTYLESQLTIEW